MRPRLLFVSTRFLFPIDSGGKIRTEQILRGMKGGAFHVTLMSPARPGSHDRYRVQLDAVCDQYLFWDEPNPRLATRLLRARHILSCLPISVRSDLDVRGVAMVGAAVERDFDVVVFDFAHAAILAPDNLLIASVLFTHNVEAEIYARHAQRSANGITRAAWANQHKKMVRFERKVLRKFDVVVAVSERDATMIRTDYGASCVQVIPTGVDLDYFKYDEPVRDNDIVFCGSMDWLANQDGVTHLMDEIWPRIAEAVPDARATIVGRAPPAALIERAKRRRLNWVFTGYVDDVRTFVGGAAVAVIPLRIGGGTRLKVFEAMAMGTPVVSTSIGVEGLNLVPDAHYLDANDPEMFAAQTLRLMKDRHKRTSLSRAARAIVDAQFSYQAAAEAFAAACQRAIDIRSPTSTFLK